MILGEEDSKGFKVKTKPQISLSDVWVRNGFFSWLVYDDIRMSLGVIYRVSFGFWGDFWKKIARKEKPEKFGQNGSYVAA